MKKKRVIILGAGGFVSSHVEKKLYQLNIECIAFSRKKLDLTKEISSKFLKNFLKKDDYVFFAAAKAPVKNMEMLIYNLNMLRNISNGVECGKIKKLIYLSSDAVYQDTKKKINEESKVAPSSFHGQMHYLRETYLESIYKKKICIVRPTLIFGPLDPHNGYGPNKFIRETKKNKPIILFGKGEEKRDHIFINDVSSILCKLMINNFFGKINLATGKVETFYNISKKINSLANNSKKILFLKRKGPLPHLGYRAFDNKKLRKLFSKIRFKSLNQNITDQFNNY